MVSMQQCSKGTTRYQTILAELFLKPAQSAENQISPTNKARKIYVEAVNSIRFEK